jgi:small subunit ribosomal protein S20
MATHKSAEKKIRQTAVRTERNKSRMSKMKTFIKKVEAAIKAKDKEKAKVALKEAESVIAKTAQKGTVKKETASRKTSRLSKAVKAIK